MMVKIRKNLTSQHKLCRQNAATTAPTAQSRPHIRNLHQKLV